MGQSRSAAPGQQHAPAAAAAAPLNDRPRRPPPLLPQSNIGIAFDMMSLNLADLARVPRLVPAATLMFAEPEAGDEEEGEQAQQ